MGVGIHVLLRFSPSKKKKGKRTHLDGHFAGKVIGVGIHVLLRFPPSKKKKRKRTHLDGHFAGKVIGVGIHVQVLQLVILEFVHEGLEIHRHFVHLV